MDISFRRLTRDDFPRLSHWLAQPHVRRWWAHDPSPDSVEDDFGDTVDGIEPAEDFVIEVGGVPAGVMQYCRFVDYPDYVEEMADVYPVGAGAATIDYFIGELDLVGRGVGTAVIAAFVDRVWSVHPDVTHLVVPVNSLNVASWRALQKAGFRLVAEGDLEPDNADDPHAHHVLRIDRPSP
jgi:aminoglycoside 6'-N-acetyltransferase